VRPFRFRYRNYSRHFDARPSLHYAAFLFCATLFGNNQFGVFRCEP
jgi:hypothetical protein